MAARGEEQLRPASDAHMASAAGECDAQPMAPIEPDDLPADNGSASTNGRAHPARDRDGIASLRDTEAEAGDEEEIVDDYDMDDREARELGADLDDRNESEPGFG